MASSSNSRRYDVFPSFRGEDVRKSFLSHLLKELDRKSINTFIDHGIERSRPIGTEILAAIRESRISIVIFSKNYASSTWCLNELVEIHKCYMELNQMVIPIFYNVDPWEVRKQTGEFGEVFQETCKGKRDDEKIRWRKVLAEVANMAGEDLKNWCNEANMIEKIADDVSVKLITPTNCFGDFVGIEDHIEAMSSMLYLESEDDVRMLGIVGPSGIGKSTIGRALFSQLSSRFRYRAFVAYKRTIRDDYGMKLCWEEQFLSEILCQKEIKLSHLGAVEQRLKHKKVLIVLDDVDDIEVVKTLVGQTGWFGSGSRIIVITQDWQLLKAHEIDLIYEVKFPSKDLSLKILCRSAFGQNFPPDGFMELAVEVANLSGNLPLGLSVLGSSLRGKDKEECMEMLHRLRNGLDGKIEKTLRVGYDGLDDEDKDLFLYIACLFNGKEVDEIKNLLGDSVDNIGFKVLADKSLIRISSQRRRVEMHSLLQNLGRLIVREESIPYPGKRRFLVDAKDIIKMFTNNTGTETVLGIHFNKSDINEPLFIEEKSLEGMPSLQFLIIKNRYGSRKAEVSLYLPQGILDFPRKLRLLQWDEYPSKCFPSRFKAEYLVELSMEGSKIEKLWDGTQSLGSLKKMNMSCSKYLKEIPDLYNAIHLEEIDLYLCKSLVTLPSSIQKVTKLRVLDMGECKNLKSFPTHLNLEYLEYLYLIGCSQLRNFPQISISMSPYERTIKVEDCFWNKNLPGSDYLGCLMSCMPCKVQPEYLVHLNVNGNMLEKLWQGVQSLGSLEEMDLSRCENLTEIPDLSMAPNLEYLNLSNCKSLVTFPSTIGNLNVLAELNMEGCTKLEVLPTDVNLTSLETLNLSGCSRLRSFPQISRSIVILHVNDTAIEQVPCCIKNFRRLHELTMRGCKRLKNISPNIFRLRCLDYVDFSDCGGVKTALSDARLVATMSMQDRFSRLPLFDSTEERYEDVPDIHWVAKPIIRECYKFINCLKLDGDARKLILRSYLMPTVLPGGEVPAYFAHQASGNSLTVNLSQSYLRRDFLGFKACVVVEPLTNPTNGSISIGLRWYFRGKSHVQHLDVDANSFKMDEDHLVLFHFGFPLLEVSHPSSEVDYIHVEFEFYHTQTCPPSLGRIKGCGLRLLNVSRSQYAAGRSSELDYNEQSGEIDIESRQRKKRMRMTVRTSEEPSNLLCSKTLAKTRLTSPSLELALGLGEASSQVLSSSVFSSKLNGNGASLHLSLSPSEPLLWGDALYFDPMITEQQDAETPLMMDNFLRTRSNRETENVQDQLKTRPTSSETSEARLQQTPAPYIQSSFIPSHPPTSNPTLISSLNMAPSPAFPTHDQ